VNHVEKDDPALNAITSKNYKFSYKGTTELDGRVVHVFQLKPKQKRAGLFKGRIFLDAYTASIVRAEGRMVKSPSLFIKKIDFVQDYTDIDAYTFPVHIHSEAQARVVGRAIVDISYSDYRPAPVSIQAQSGPVL
jgi:outer membrane lipoprotein-sorting protein